MLMSLEPGDETGDLENEHPRCEQWTFVVSGRGEARAKERGGRMKTIKLAAGSLLVIERQEPHQIKCLGKEPLRTINLYVPPAYDDEGEPLPSAKRRSTKK